MLAVIYLRAFSFYERGDSQWQKGVTHSDKHTLQFLCFTVYFAPVFLLAAALKALFSAAAGSRF